MSKAAGSSKDFAIVVDLDSSDDEVVITGHKSSPNIARGRGFMREKPIVLDEDEGTTRQRKRVKDRSRCPTPLHSLQKTQPQLRLQRSERSSLAATQPPHSQLVQSLHNRVREDSRFPSPASSITLVDHPNAPISPVHIIKIEKAIPYLEESYSADEYEFDASLGPSLEDYADALNDPMDVDDSEDKSVRLKDQDRRIHAKGYRSKAIPRWTRKPQTFLNAHGHWSGSLLSSVSSCDWKGRRIAACYPSSEVRRPKRGPLGPFSTVLNGSALRPLVHYAKTSGAITSIAQSGPNIAVSSAADGGMGDSEHGNLAYNRNQNLMAFRGRHSKVLEGHRTQIHYTVHDVAFDPTDENRFVSVGHEGQALVWNIQMKQLDERPRDSANVVNECLHDDDLESCRERIVCKRLPSHGFSKATQSVAFQPETSTFAVSCHNGTIHCFSKQPGRRILNLIRESDTEIAKPGHMVWASKTARRPNRLYASTESTTDNYPCVHAAFDLSTSKIVYEFAERDSSDNMVLDPFGERMALVSESNGCHRLSFFDTSREDGHVTAMTELRQPTLFGDEPLKLEVNDASFSPDGILIALARNDNVTDVYDTRFLSRVWATLPHARSSTVSRPIRDTFGVFGAHWVQGRDWGTTGLVTGGADGCVRLWDVYRAPSQPDESVVLAELNNDVAHLVIGDPYKGEKRLVVGDCGGEVYIFD